MLPPNEYKWNLWAGFSGYVCKDLDYKQWYLIKILYPETEDRTWWFAR